MQLRTILAAATLSGAVATFPVGPVAAWAGATPVPHASADGAPSAMFNSVPVPRSPGGGSGGGSSGGGGHSGGGGSHSSGGGHTNGGGSHSSGGGHGSSGGSRGGDGPKHAPEPGGHNGFEPPHNPNEHPPEPGNPWVPPNPNEHPPEPGNPWVPPNPNGPPRPDDHERHYSPTPTYPPPYCLRHPGYNSRECPRGDWIIPGPVYNYYG